MYEHRARALLSFSAFLRRLFLHGFGAVSLIVGSLLVGMAGYHWLEGLSLVDALLNASMLLGGMGPVTPLHTTAGKIFASGYALYAGMVFLIVAGLLFAPLFHRFLHHFHLEMEGED